YDEKNKGSINKEYDKESEGLINKEYNKKNEGLINEDDEKYDKENAIDPLNIQSDDILKEKFSDFEGFDDEYSPYFSNFTSAIMFF
ncbi:1332_t:CDS:2, partial [Funneliformis mosseae]